MGHVGDGTFGAVQVSRGQPGGTGHGRLLRSEDRKGKVLSSSVHFSFNPHYLEATLVCL